MPSEKKEIGNNFLDKIRGNPWIASTIVLGILLVAFLAFSGSGRNSGFASESEVRENVVNFLNSRVSEGTVELVSLEKENGLYKAIVSYQGSNIPLYITNDGKNLVSDLVPLNGDAASSSTTSSTPTFANINEADIADAPVLGSKTAPVTIVEFSDYQCPFCRSFWFSTLPDLKEGYIDTGKAKLVFIDLPLSFHPGAIPYAVAARCAREKGGDVAYYKMHDKIFAEQNKLDGGTVKTTITYVGDVTLKKWAKDIGYNIDTCFDGDKYEAEVQADTDYALSVLGNEVGTPTFTINGKIISGAQPYSAFQQIIEQELAG